MALLVLACAAAFASATVLTAAEKAPETKLSAEQEEFFEKKIRPMLVQNCVNCHGPDEQEGGLRLDSRDFLMKGGDGQPVAVPGDPDKSRLISVTRYDGSVQMPPDGKLTEEDFNALVAWVKMGLPWPQHAEPEPASAAPSKDPKEKYAELRATHWAFQPIHRTRPPEVKNKGWIRTPVDNFILAKLEEKGLEPSPAVDARTLLRRVTIDLTGLPPTAEDTAAFLADSSPEAYRKVVERLLASPQYGERWGRHWLDVARYADTKGYVFTDEPRYPYAYTYRDYVIRAFNTDLPYDQFVLEQLAADQLPENDDKTRLAGLGFLTVGRRFGNNINDIIDDRIDVVSRGLMGLSVGCARCHDHKYDPIPTDDYYSLYGVFASCNEPDDLPQIGESPDKAAYQEYLTELGKRQTALSDFRSKQLADLRSELRTHVGDYLAQVIVERKKKDKSNKDDFEYSFTRGEPRPQFVKRWSEYLSRHSRIADPVFSVWHRYAALPADEKAFEDGTKKILAEIEAAKDPKKPVNKLVREAFLKARPTSMADVVKTYDQLFAAYASNEEPLADADAEQLRQVLYGSDSPVAMSDKDIDGLFDRKTRDANRKLESKIEAHKASSPGSPPRAMVLVDNEKPTQAAVFVRGNPGRRGKQVPRQFLEAIAGTERKPFEKGSGRLELARAIVAPENPLTARVMANRVWMHHFGVGLVRTPSDFGLRSDPPSHPELLDWLAASFREEGWSVKNLHRLIVLSSAYRQASVDDSAKSVVDPENQYLWRMNPRRLEFEALRDSMLAVAGRLDLSMGGRSVNLTRIPLSTRRTVYGIVDRQDLPSMFQVFDFASPDASTDQRSRTTVPQQALFVMNSRFALEQARAAASHEDVSSKPDNSAKIRALFVRVLGREPKGDELADAEQFLDRAATLSTTTALWQYGVGRYDDKQKAVVDFRRFEHWTGEAWQPAAKYPDSEFNYTQIHAEGGHPGFAKHMTVVRWTAPHDCAVAIDGKLGHNSDKGDGVQARVFDREGKQLGKWVAANKKLTTKIERVELKRGDWLDFVVDCRTGNSYDSYTWSPMLTTLDADTKETWNAETEFQGPRLSPLEQLAQVLMLTNEFTFID